MRILQVTDFYPPQVGGLEVHVQQLSHELARRGHDIEVAALAGPGGTRTESDEGIVVHRVAGWSQALDSFHVDATRPFHPTFPDPAVVRSLMRLIRRYRPDIVHAHSWIVHSLLPVLSFEDTRLVVTMHDYGLVCAKKTFVHRNALCSGPKFAKCVGCASGQYGPLRAFALTAGLAAMRPLRGRVGCYIANSAVVARACQPLFATGRPPIEIVPPFLPEASFSMVQGDRPPFVPATGDYLMFAGALSPHKGLEVLLEARAGLDPAIPLVVAGIRHANSPDHFPPDVIVAENRPRADIMRAWAHCLAAVVPSIGHETFGLVALEAMAAGRPVVATAVGGLADLVVDGTTGLLVPPGDVSALRDAIQRLLSDPRRRADMGAAARRRAAEFSADMIVPRIERIYREVVSGGTSSGDAMVVDDLGRLP
jgi:glycosyltransferase involved in cell wall biosynthesis